LKDVITEQRLKLGLMNFDPEQRHLLSYAANGTKTKRRARTQLPQITSSPHTAEIQVLMALGIEQLGDET